ncbi:putative epoxidase hydrolase [Trichoderma atroviride IMI 206040]|uniref:Epoxidase hydrolase n=1 Tax=Hypocrea atroviridis (strain ATCC 20476 / IMI 206040) TaxID=452589 RepID=G9NQX5_HYPAI|nr:putative epoxidase hydrolase [Trichoderma atroviride IMI 206040]EHK46945.1 putative epoxidase hydrolase [Trichoderma atroviride IMI 206040]
MPAPYRAPATLLWRGALAFHTLTPIRFVNTSTLSIAYYDSAPRDSAAPVAILVHGFPYSIDTYVDVVPKLSAKGYRLIVPYLRGHGTTSFLSPSTPRSAEQAALGKDIVDLMDALSTDKAIFAGFDWGSVAVNVAAALGPDRCTGMVAANSCLIQNRQTAWATAPSPSLATRWFLYVLLTPQAYSALAMELDAAVPAFRYPDYVDIATNFYKNRLLYAPGDPAYAELAGDLDLLPVIRVPSVTLDPDQAPVFPATNGSSTAQHFSGPRVHHIVQGCGENIPLQSPQVFAEAVLEVAALGRRHN